MDTSNIVSDSEIEALSVAQLEDLEFRIYVELRNREDEILNELQAEAEDYSSWYRT